MKKILVTGANGYIGKFVRNYIESLENVEGIYIDISDESYKGYIKADIFSDDFDYAQFSNVNALIHLAWRDGFMHNSQKHVEDVSNHFKFLTRLTDNGVRHICVLGTMHEVGYYEGEITENTPTNPLSLYGLSKNFLRQSLEIYFKDKDIIFQWLRVFYIYGGDEDNKSIFSKILDADKKGLKEFPFNSGKNKYDFIHIEELAKQIVETSLQQNVNGIINCCSGFPISLSQKVNEFIKDNKLHIKLLHGAYPDREYDSPIIYGNNEKIKSILERK